MTGAGAAAGPILILVRIAPRRARGAAGEEVGAGPRHSSFLFLAHPADLEFEGNSRLKGAAEEERRRLSPSSIAHETNVSSLQPSDRLRQRAGR